MAKDRIGISIDVNLKNKLAKQAKKEGFTPTSLLTKIVAKYVKKRDKKNGTK